MPLIAFDSGYLSAKDRKRDLQGQECIKILVGRDQRSTMVFAHTVSSKGVSHSPYNVQCMMRDLRRLGYNKLILKSDNKRSIVYQVIEMAKLSGIEVIPEFSATNDSQSNGLAERVVGLTKSKARSVIAGLEPRLR